MDEGSSAKQIKKAIEHVYKPSYELTFFKNLISAFYLQGTDSEVVEKILIELYNQLPSHEKTLGDIVKLFDDIYIGDAKPNSGLKGIEQFITDKHDKKTALELIRDLNKIIIPYDTNKIYKLQIGSNKYIVMDYRNNEVTVQIIDWKKGIEVTDYTRILLCYPVQITIHDNPISDAGRTFSIEWVTTKDGHFHTKNMSIPEIEQYLTDHGYVLSPKHFKGVVTALIQIAIENELAIIKNDIETPGFYYNDITKSLNIIDFELKPVNFEKLNMALDLIEDLKNYFVGQETKLATTLKHALIVPFGFAKKQMGLPLENLIPYIYHFGKGGSGKTTIARIGAYFYGEPNSETDIGGSEFDTVPRIGAQISKSTFGLIVNEPDNVFNNRSCVETLKTCVERTNARRRYEGRNLATILALSTVSFTSNSALPNVEGLTRRFVQLLYSHSEKKSDSEKKAFMEHFRMDTPELCLFHRLKYLADFAVNEINNDIELLRLPWQELSNSLILRAYADCERQCPEWLLSFAEAVTLEELDDEEIDEIRMFFIDEINKHNKNIRVYSSEDGFPMNQDDFFSDNVKDSRDFSDRVFNVINERLIPYMVLHHARNGKDYVCFTSGLKKAMHNVNQACYDVKGIAELLGWKYKLVRLDKPRKVMLVRFDKFLTFLYPNLSEKGDN
ncbi:hypothetical protein [uncultured Methanobrevibacter sp.]|uniref:hypothetical protein n=1 Tax=uncultured Methanobrevibacter sp. TaxID=253161 RepID=UPI0025DD83BA|nr:hypothetical protein [uncultured Methanobrevibacter sp.]